MGNELYNVNLERTLLASLVFEPQLIGEFHHQLRPNDLCFHEANKNILRAMLELYDAGSPVDETFINQHLKKSKINVEVELVTILTANPTANLEPYLDALRELADKRYLLSLVHTFNRDLHEGPLTSQELLSKTIDRLEGYRQDHRIELFTSQDITDIAAEEADFICKEWLPFPKKTVSLVTAPGGSGKSWLVLQLMMRHLVESPNAKAFAWLSEDPTGLTAHRAGKISDAILSRPLQFFKGKLVISNSPTVQVLLEQGRGVEINAFFSDLKKSLSPYELIILDPLIAFFGADENNNAHARKFMQLFTEWAANENKTIIFIHHSTKNTTQSRGASAFTDAVRLVYEISVVTDKQGNVDDTRAHMRKITLTKDNYGASKFLGGKSTIRQIFPQTKPEIQTFMKDF